MTDTDILAEVKLGWYSGWQVVLDARQVRAVVESLQRRGHPYLTSTQPDGSVRLLSPGRIELQDAVYLNRWTMLVCAETMVREQHARYHEARQRSRWA